MEKTASVTEKKGSTSKTGCRPPNFSGYTLFTEEFFRQKEEDKKKEKEGDKHNRKGKGKGKGEKDVNPFKKINLDVREAWSRLSDNERGEYSKRAEKLRGPGKRRMYIVPFLTRSAPKQFIAVCKNLKGRPDVMKRLKSIGFDKLVNISCPHIPRDLCAEFMRCFDPPTKQVSIRGETHVVGAEDVRHLLGLPHGGVKIEVKVDDDDAHFNDLRSVYKNVKYQTIGEWLMGKSDENLEILFVIFALGTLLSPSASIYVSERVLKLVTVTKDALGDFDWSSFIFDEVCHAIRDFKRESMKGEGKGRKTVGGCIYFIMLFCLQHFPLGQLKDCTDEQALAYWTDERVKNRVKVEKESKKGLLHGLRNVGGHAASTFNADSTLTHPVMKQFPCTLSLQIGSDSLIFQEIRRTYARLVSMVGEELLALQNRLDEENDNKDDVAEQVHDEEESVHEGEEENEDEGEEENEEKGEEGTKDEGEDEEDTIGEAGENVVHDVDGEEDVTAIEVLQAHDPGHPTGTLVHESQPVDEMNKEGDLELRRSKRVITPSWVVKSPWIDTLRKSKGKRTHDEKDTLYELCTTRCNEADGEE